MSKEMLRELKFGSDVKEDLEDISPGTAVFLWDYQKQRMHGIFAGTTKPVEDTPRDTPYLYEVCCWPPPSLQAFNVHAEQPD